jgi:hypothetical protein
MTLEGTLLFALNAVGLAFVFLSHDDPPIATRSKLREPPGSERAYENTIPAWSVERAI